MKKLMFACFDQKTKLFGLPFYSVRREQALRDFAYAANDPETEICRYSLDYSLFYIGTFDDETGELEMPPMPEHICQAFTLKETQIPGSVQPESGVTKQ